MSHEAHPLSHQQNLQKEKKKKDQFVALDFIRDRRDELSSINSVLKSSWPVLGIFYGDS